LYPSSKEKERKECPRSKPEGEKKKKRVQANFQGGKFAEAWGKSTTSPEFAREKKKRDAKGCGDINRGEKKGKKLHEVAQEKRTPCSKKGKGLPRRSAE